jgi:cytochrome c-type biogenesis protein
MLLDSASYPAALMAGLLSFFSPCILPLIPAYFTFITGLSLDEMSRKETTGVRKKVIISTAAYIAGFSFIFVLMGASATLLGTWINAHTTPIRVGGGIIVLVMGLHVSGVIRIPFMDYEKKIHVNRAPLHLVGIFLVGMAFGAGWSPCIGPLLGTILILASSQDTLMQGMMLLGVYAAGLGLPFILLSFFIHFILEFIKKAGKMIRYMNMTAGALLIVLGGLLILDMLRPL